MSVLERLNTAIEAAKDEGLVDPVKQGAIIEAAQKVATVMDEPEWPIVRGKIDNVSPSVFLKYCDKLGIAEIKKEVEPTEAKPLRLVGNSKWKKKT